MVVVRLVESLLREQSHQPWNFLSILDVKIRNIQPVLLQFNKSEMQDRTYVVSEKLARGKAASAKHSDTPVLTDTVRERNTSPEPQ